MFVSIERVERICNAASTNPVMLEIRGVKIQRVGWRFIVHNLPPKVANLLSRTGKVLNRVGVIMAIFGAITYILELNMGLRLITASLALLTFVAVGRDSVEYKYSATIRTPRMSVGDSMSLPGPITIPKVEYLNENGGVIEDEKKKLSTDHARIKLTPTHIQFMNAGQDVTVDIPWEVNKIDLALDETQMSGGGEIRIQN